MKESVTSVTRRPEKTALTSLHKRFKGKAEQFCNTKWHYHRFLTTKHNLLPNELVHVFAKNEIFLH